MSMLFGDPTPKRTDEWRSTGVEGCKVQKPSRSSSRSNLAGSGEYQFRWMACVSSIYHTHDFLMSVKASFRFPHLSNGP